MTPGEPLASLRDGAPAQFTALKREWEAKALAQVSRRHVELIGRCFNVPVWVILGEPRPRRHGKPPRRRFGEV